MSFTSPLTNSWAYVWILNEFVEKRGRRAASANSFIINLQLNYYFPFKFDIIF
jgi:hypothetical protein